MKRIKLNKNDIIIYLFCFYSFIEILLSTEITYIIDPKYLSLVKYLFGGIAIICLGLNILKSRITPRVFIFMILAILGALILLEAKKLHILMLVIFMYSFKDYKLEYLLKHFLPVLVFTFILTILCSLTNIYPNVHHERQGVIRNALGFFTPTLGQSVLLFITLSVFYLRKNKLSWVSIIIFLALNVVIYYFTAGRTGFYLSVAVLALIALYKLVCKTRIIDKIILNKPVSLFLIGLPIIFLLLTLLLTKLYNDGYGFAIKLNDFLSTRLLLQKNAIIERNITMFGQDIYWFNAENIYIGVDNSYLYHLYNYGFVIFILAIVSYMLIIKKSTSKKDYPLLIIACIILIDAILEPYMIDFKYNYFVFSIAYLFKENYNIKMINNELCLY